MAAMRLDEPGPARLLREQGGIVARRQLLDLGATAHDVRRWLRRRELTTVHTGVYVDHTGRLSRRQREWAAVLACAPAALHRESALTAAGLTRDRHGGSAAPIHIAIDARRTVRELPGVRVERVRRQDVWVEEQRRPPRVTVEYAALKVASTAAESGAEAAAVAVLADVCRQGLSTPRRLLSTLERLPRLPGRGCLADLLQDVDAGVHSVLEHRYLTDVEQAHGLPVGERQVRVVSAERVVFRDVRYGAHRTLVELDGRFGHSDADDRWSDLDRDLAAAVSGQVTVRLGWAQVLQPCRIAGALARILRARGWRLVPTPCGPACTLDRVDSWSPTDADPTQSPRSA
jgi:hypothetical protein